MFKISKEIKSPDLTFTKSEPTSGPSIIRNIIEVEGNGHSSSLRLYPRNTPEILINLEDPLQGKMEGKEVTVHDVTIQGSKSRYVRVRHPKDCHFLSIRFTPNGFYKLFGIPQSKFTDEVFPLKDIVGHIDPLVPLLKNVSSKKERLDVLVDWMSRFLSWKNVETNLLSDFIMKQVSISPSITVSDMAEKTGYSRKHLAQTFKEEVGLTIKNYQKIHRICNILKSISDSTRTSSYAQLACKFGYYDQSHFIKDFKRYTGYTPTIYQRMRKPTQSIAR